MRLRLSKRTRFSKGPAAAGPWGGAPSGRLGGLAWGVPGWGPAADATAPPPARAPTQVGLRRFNPGAAGQSGAGAGGRLGPAG